MGNSKLFEDIIYSFFCKNLGKCVEFYGMGFGNQFLYKVMNYCERFQKTFLEVIFSSNLKTDPSFKQFFSEILNKLVHFIYQIFAKTTINQLFNIILDAENVNINLIHEMKDAIEKTDMVPFIFYYFQANLLIIKINQMASNLLKQINSRLLISGVLTQNIINYFISTIKILQLLDPLGIVFGNLSPLNCILISL